MLGWPVSRYILFFIKVHATSDRHILRKPADSVTTFAEKTQFTPSTHHLVYATSFHTINSTLGIHKQASLWTTQKSGSEIVIFRQCEKLQHNNDPWRSRSQILTYNHNHLKRNWLPPSLSQLSKDEPIWPLIISSSANLIYISKCRDNVLQHFQRPKPSN